MVVIVSDMKSKLRLQSILLSVFFLSLYSETSFSQSTLLRDALKSRSKHFDTLNNQDIQASFYNYKDGSLNYLKPLTHLLLTDTLGWKREDLMLYHEISGQMYSFIGDVDNAAFSFSLRENLDPISKSKVSKDDVNAFTNHSFKDLLTEIGQNRVLMFNEAHHIPLQRTFVASLLPQLKSMGFKYLALEALNGDVNSGAPLSSLGYYTRDPQMYNLITYAQILGFDMIRYEPPYFPGYNRDSLQAENIYSVIKKDTDAKVVVLAGYGHIQEGFNRMRFKPLGTAIKDISGIDPLTINLIDFNQYSSFSSSLKLYKYLIEKFQPRVPTVLKRHYESDVTFREGYDYYMLFPEYGELYHRPEWLSLNSAYKKQKVKMIAGSYLIQAYKSNPKLDFKDLTRSGVPSDQCYNLKEQGVTMLYLFPGEYDIVYRDIDYKIIKVVKVVVK